MKLIAISFLVSLVFGSLDAKATQNDVITKSSEDGKFVVNQLCNSMPSNADISSLKKEVKMLRKELAQALEKNRTKGERTQLYNLHFCIFPF